MSILYPRPQILCEFDPEKHAVIEASAGTGKTFTLEHMIVDILLRNPELKIEHILVVTFTERATAELKVRVRGLLTTMIHATRELADAPDDEFEPMFGNEIDVDPQFWAITAADRARLERALFSFDIAPIYTIHGFCQRILTEYAFANQRFYDQHHIDFPLLFDRAFTDAMRRTLSCQDETRDWLEAWLEMSSVEELKSLLSRCLMNPSEIWPRLFDDDLTSLLEQFGPDFWRYYRHFYKKSCGRRERAFKKAQKDYCESGSVARFLMLVDDEVIDLKHSLRQSEPTSPKQQQFMNLVGRLLRFKPAIAQKFLPVMKEAVDREKQRLGAYTYDDMLALVWQSLSRPSGKWLTQVLRRRYRYALIDEFQDTDELQWQIFKHIFYDSPTNNKLFLIGDPKQAIYGFRGADVYTYLRACDVILAPPEEREDDSFEVAEVPSGQKLRLGHNYRSTSALIDAYNAIFNQNAEHPFFSGTSIQYAHPVQCGQADLVLEDVDGQAVSPIVLGQMKRKPGKKAAATTDEIYECYGRWIASEIRSLLTESGQLRFGKAGETERICAKDIFVLTRSGADERRLEKFLQEAGVPYAVFKHEGLFQTQEAHELYVLLRAIDDPHDRGKRLKAWETPFFGVEMEHLAQCRDLTESEPMFKLLLDWNHLARHQRFEALFTDILQQSGLVRREIFFKDSERELTNYLHLMEVLLEEVYLGRLDMRQLVVRMSAFLENKRKPIGDDSNVKRLESDRDAVQLLTMHKSKGLEAEIVFLYPFGGSSGEYWPFHYTNHSGEHMRAMHILKPEAKISPKLRQRVDVCAREENERLFYVALTRAKARLYLPYVPHVGNEPICKAISTRSYDVLNRQLFRMLPDIQKGTYDTLFDLRDIPYFGRHIPNYIPSTNPDVLAKWEPPVEYMRASTDDAQMVQSVPLSRSLASYSSLKRRQGGYHVATLSEEELRAEDEIGASEESIIGQDELPGGVRTGQCLHDVLERLDYKSLTEYEDVDQWCASPKVLALFEESLIQHGLEFDVLPLCQRIIHRSLTATIEVDHGVIYGLGLCIPNVRELAFYYPIPDDAHPTLSQMSEAPWVVDKGFVKGYIDYVFQWDERIYFVDWKSDVLERYEGTVLQQHFEENYMIQVMLYVTALCKVAGIHDEETYEARFGSAIYCFLRGMTDDSHLGICRHRPSWQALLDFEIHLRQELSS